MYPLDINVVVFSFISFTTVCIVYFCRWTLNMFNLNKNCICCSLYLTPATLNYHQRKRYINHKIYKRIFNTYLFHFDLNNNLKKNRQVVYWVCNNYKHAMFQTLEYTVKNEYFVSYFYMWLIGIRKYAYHVKSEI